MNLFKICQLSERVLVSQWNVDDTVMSKGAQGVVNGRLLSTSRPTGRHEDTSVFTSESTGCPKPTSRVPERLPLGREVSKSSRNTEEESVVGGEDVWCDDWVVGFGGSVHQPQDVF